jgi:alpha-glucosidase
MFEDDQFRNEELSSWMNPGDEIKNYDDLNHTYTKDLNDTFEFVYDWRKMIDEYRVEKGIETDILIMTEAYASIEDTMRYYRNPSNENRRGAHMPFNFQLIWAFNRDGKASDLKGSIDWFRDHMPSGETANWVAGSHDHSRVASRVATEFIHIVNTVVTTLPGASITYYV